MRVSEAAEKLDAISWNIALLIHIGVAQCKMIGFTHLEMVDFGLDRTVRIRCGLLGVSEQFFSTPIKLHTGYRVISKTTGVSIGITRKAENSEIHCVGVVVRSVTY